MAMLDELNYRTVIDSYDTQDWQPLLQLVPEIATTQGFKTVGSSGWFEWAPVVKAFHNAAYEIPIVVNYDWGRWAEGKRWIYDPEFDYDSIDPAEKCRLLTMILRAERFSEGFLVRKFEDGTILRILQSITREMAD